MYAEGRITDLQNHGILVCVPKTMAPTTVEDYKPLALLNTYYKILARIIANILRPLVSEILHPSQFCGRQGASIHDALSTIRDTIAYAEETGRPICVLSIDFESALENVSHTYLRHMLQRYELENHIIRLIGNMYNGATSSIQVNGYLTAPIPINRSIRQGCPLNMLLYALCINPLLQHLNDILPGVRMLASGSRTSVVAYADDVTIFLTDPRDIARVETALKTYTAASGAVIILRKSKAMALGP
jgi:hypothetical protein